MKNKMGVFLFALLFIGLLACMDSKEISSTDINDSRAPLSTTIELDNEIESASNTEKETADTIFENINATDFSLAGFIDEVLEILGRGDVSYSEYRYDCIFNFGGYLLKSDAYIEKKHTEDYPDAYYSLGGVGQCIDPNYKAYATYIDGKLNDFKWMNNHSCATKILSYETDRDSGCIYKYTFDISKFDTEDYWVAFFSISEEDEPYVVFLNSSIFSREDILKILGVS